MKKLYSLTIFFVFLILIIPYSHNVFAMPYYDLSPENLTERSRFSTSIASSSIERKNNIILACKLINKTFLDVNKEFSFNRTVGERTKERGFYDAKIIKDGKFVDGIGGGICQVSTTLYNAVLLSDLKITEFHHHSLPISYVKPSFDAMVNSGSADLRFINNTKNPIIIYAEVQGDIVQFVIYGEPKNYTVSLESVLLEKLPCKTEYIADPGNLYPEITQGKSLVLQYGKPGYISEGYTVKKKHGKIISRKRIRHDIYNPVNTIIVKK